MEPEQESWIFVKSESLCECPTQPITWQEINNSSKADNANR